MFPPHCFPGGLSCEIWNVGKTCAYSLALALGNHWYFSPYIGCYKQSSSKKPMIRKEPRHIQSVISPLSSSHCLVSEQVETLKDLEDDPNAALFFDNSKA